MDGWYLPPYETKQLLFAGAFYTLYFYFLVGMVIKSIFEETNCLNLGFMLKYARNDAFVFFFIYSKMYLLTKEYFDLTKNKGSKEVGSRYLE